MTGTFVTVTKLEKCFQDILCSMSQGTLNLLSQSLKIFIQQLQAKTLAYRAKLAYLDLATAPLVVAQKAIQSLLTEAQGLINIIPLDLIGNCANAQNLSLSIKANTDIIFADVNAVLSDSIRLISLRDEAEAVLAEIDAVIRFYTSVLDHINICAEVKAQRDKQNVSNV